MLRLFRSTISFEDSRDVHQAWMDLNVAPAGELTWDAKPVSQKNLWESWIELSEGFFEAITAAPVPVDLRALKTMRRSPLALDLYPWCAHGAIRPRNRQRERKNPGAICMLSSEAGTRNYSGFARLSSGVLAKIRTVYPELNVTTTSCKIIIWQSLPPIPPKSSFHIPLR